MIVTKQLSTTLLSEHTDNRSKPCETARSAGAEVRPLKVTYLDNVGVVNNHWNNVEEMLLPISNDKHSVKRTIINMKKTHYIQQHKLAKDKLRLLLEHERAERRENNRRISKKYADIPDKKLVNKFKNLENFKTKTKFIDKTEKVINNLNQKIKTISLREARLGKESTFNLYDDFHETSGFLQDPGFIHGGVIDFYRFTPSHYKNVFIPGILAIFWIVKHPVLILPTHNYYDLIGKYEPTLFDDEQFTIESPPINIDPSTLGLPPRLGKHFITDSDSEYHSVDSESDFDHIMRNLLFHQNKNQELQNKIFELEDTKSNFQFGNVNKYFIPILEVVSSAIIAIRRTSDTLARCCILHLMFCNICSTTLSQQFLPRSTLTCEGVIGHMKDFINSKEKAFYDAFFNYLLQREEDYVATGPDFLDSPIFTECSKFLAEIIGSGLMTNLGLWTSGFHSSVTKVYRDATQGKTILMTALNILKLVIDGTHYWWETGDIRNFYKLKGASSYYSDLIEIKGDVLSAAGGLMTPDEMLCLSKRIADLDEGLNTLGITLGILHPNHIAVRTMMSELKEYRQQLTSLRCKGEVRRSPIGVQIHGPPGIGKSVMLYNLLMIALVSTGVLKENEPGNMAYISHINEADKYDSTINASTLAIVIDDVGKYRPKTINGAPGVSKIIEFSNPVPSPALKADLKEKGIVYPNHTVLAVTSNTRDMGITDSCTTPGAVYRRLPFYITVSIGPTYRTSIGDINFAKMNEDGKKLFEICNYTIHRRTVGVDGAVHYHDLTAPCDWYQDGDGNNKISYHTLMKIFKNNCEKEWQKSTNYQKDILKIFENKCCDLCHLPKLREVCPCNAVVAARVATNLPIEEGIYLPTNAFDVVSDRGRKLLDYLLYPFYYISYNIRLGWYGAKMLENIDYLQEAYIRINDDAKNRISNFGSRHLIITAIIGGLCTAFTGYKIYQSLTNGNINYEETVKMRVGQNVIDVTLPPPSELAPYTYPSKTTVNQRVVLEKVESALLDPKSNTTFNKLLGLVAENSYLMYVDSGYVNGCFISNHLFMTVAHIFPKDFLDIDKGVVISVRLMNMYCTTQTFQIERNHVHICEDNDLAFILFPAINPKKDISKYIRGIKDGGALPLDEVVMYSLRYENNKVTSEKKIMQNGKLGNVRFICKTGVNMMTRGFVFPYTNAIGSSGSIVLLQQGQTASIIGVQSASSETMKSCAIQGLNIKFREIEDELKSKTFIPTMVWNKNYGIELNSTPGPYSIYSHLVGSAIDYVGTIPNYVGVKNKSSFRKSLCYDLLTVNGLFYIKDELISNDRYIIPELSPFSVRENDDIRWVSPKLVGTADACSPDTVEPAETLIRHCFEDYVSVFSQIDFPTINGPLSLHQAINGVEGITAMNKNASAGYGMKGLFKDYLDKVDEVNYKLKPSIEREFREYEKSIFNTCGPIPIMKANVKDEIIKESKQICPRIFMSSPMYFTLLCKIWIMPIANIILLNPDLFEIAVGINAMGKGWTNICHKLNMRKFVFDGDYRKFDKRQLRLLLLLFISFLVMIAERVKYPPYGIYMLRVLLFLMVFYCFEMGGDIYELYRSLASGCLMTIFMNCFVNSMYYRMAWFTKTNVPFRQRNTLVTYGDDSVNGTDDEWFNLIYMQEIMKQYGIDFTPADKSKIGVKFTPINEVTFLKRGFRKENLDGEEYYLCPLNEVSIVKMLCFTDSKLEEEKLILLNNIIDAHKQYWFHGKEKFLSRKMFLQRLVYQLNLSNSISDNKDDPLHWFTYDEMKNDFINGRVQIQFV